MLALRLPGLFNKRFSAGLPVPATLICAQPPRKRYFVSGVSAAQPPLEERSGPNFLIAPHIARITTTSPVSK